MEKVPGTPLLCLSVSASRSNLVVVTASVKSYPEPMTVLIDSGASFNFATKASVAKNNALYASALEASKSNTNASARLATDWRSRTIGGSHNPLADRALVGHAPSSSRDGFVHEHCVPRHERQFIGSSEVLELPTVSPPRAREPEVGDGEKPQDPDTSPMGRQGSAVCNRVACVQRTVTTQGADASTARAGRGGSVRAPPTHSVAAGSAHVEEGAGALELVLAATTGGRAGASTSMVIRGDKVTSSRKAEASGRDADSAAEDRAPQVLDVFPGEVLTPLPTVAELLELEELSYVEFLGSLKPVESAEVVLLRPEGGSLELNSSSVMDSEVLEDERTSRRQTRYGAAILKDPSDPYYPLLKEFSDAVSDDPPSVLPPDRGVRHEIDLVPGTKYCTTRQWPLPKEQVDVIDAFFAAKHAAGMVRESKSPHSSPTVLCAQTQRAFEAIKNSLQSAPILALPDDDRPFSVLCDASDFAIGCALLQVDAEGREQVVSFQSRQLKAAEKNYPVHDKERLAMKYALVKFRVHLLGQKPFVIYTDHASLKTATSSPHLSQRKAQWLSFFAEYNFTVEYKPRKQNVLADALSRRPDYELAHLAYLESPL
ncbi:unnamed protein product [Phytophthora fragariaefolia]|uniref:Unnamed protein product n=1 Tax=Phytophthora fragariaefolia TaxID=1490495 RepID=A0A9W6XE64_9STRA|nr:unnamed protein product [Phytophthora fragariaefolia]